VPQEVAQDETKLKVAKMATDATAWTKREGLTGILLIAIESGIQPSLGDEVLRLAEVVG
jgi:hypothetical protein